MVGTRESMHKEEKAQHRDGQAGENLQRGMSIPAVVGGQDLIILLGHVVLASGSVVYIQVISQFCERKRRMLKTQSPTASD